MRHLVMTVIFLISLILQSTLFTHLAIAGVKPDLILIFVVLYAFLNGPREGAVIGIIGGLVQDLLFGQYIGLNAITKLTVGFLFGYLERKIYKENLLIPMLVVFAATIANESILYFFRSSVSVLPGFLESLERIILVMGFYNSFLTIFIYRKFYKSSQNGWLMLE